MDFTNEIVLVTGSSRGIGKAIAYAFAKCGAKVVLNGGTNKERLLATYEAFKAENLQVTYFFGDVSSYETTQALFKHIKMSFGCMPSIVINNAGISITGLFTDTTPEMWNNILSINLNSAYNCIQQALPHMLSVQSGIIINISSIWGNVGASCEVAYSTTKSALNGLTKSLAKELGPSNIRVNAVLPGMIRTDRWEKNPDFYANVPSRYTPIGDVADAKDIADAVWYFASLARNTTGAELVVDGGNTIQLYPIIPKE